jgi:hypothetical protein
MTDANHKPTWIVPQGVTSTLVVAPATAVGATSGGVALGTLGAGAGAALGMLVAGPPGAAVGYLIGIGLGSAGGVAGGGYVGFRVGRSLQRWQQG